MTAATPSVSASRRIIRLQLITLIWMSVEAAVSLGTAWRARSPALLGFGGDSLIELVSAAVVLWRFRFRLDERRAAQIAGALLVALAGLVVLTSVSSLLGYREPQRSLIGIAILLAAAVAMPLLASQKRKLAIVTSSAALSADAAESAICGYMAWIALAGLTVNAVWGKPWADPLAALGLTPLIVREALEAFRAKHVCGHCSD